MKAISGFPVTFLFILGALLVSHQDVVAQSASKAFR